MPAVFKFEGKEQSHAVKFDGDDIRVIAGDVAQVRIATSLALMPAYDPDKFDFHLLLKPDVKENDSKQVHSKIVGDTVRIGWAIPVLSLVSDQHDHASNEHFLRYAFLAILMAVDLVSAQVEVELSELAEIDILKLLGEDAVILVISKVTLQKGHDFELKRALPSLVSQGYADGASDVEVGSRWLPREQEKDVVKIVLSSKCPDDHDMVAAMLNGFVSSHRSLALQFFYLYQIVELLMERVISIRQKEIADSIIQAGASSAKIRAALEKIVEINSERSKMNLVVDRYARISGDLRELRIDCNKLQVKLGLDVGEGIADYLYPLRNYIFHNFRSFPKDAEPELRAVVTALVIAIPLFLSKFDYG